MTVGVGGSNAEQELLNMTSMTDDIVPISDDELVARVERVRAEMRANGVAALYLDTSPSLQYFVGLKLSPTERLYGVVIPAEGPVITVSPAFEEPKTRDMLRVGNDVRVWQEHEDPTAVVIETMGELGCAGGAIAVDPATPFFTFDGLRRAGNRYDFLSGADVIAQCRAHKSPAEIALMQRANQITLEVHKAAARIMAEGITTTEVAQFVRNAHRRLGAEPAGQLVLFGEATAYPHGVDHPQVLKPGDMVLIDAGCAVGGYRSDITRTYVFGTPTVRQREVWEIEQRAQAAGFAAAKPGAPCHAVDDAARGTIEAAGFAKDYALPGLPHRTGHGIGLEVHEERYIVRGNRTPLAAGMCFSIEPTICIYGEFGIRLEDCAYMSDSAAHWFTAPCHSVEDPFGYEA